jgi:NADH-ubiquinone oxidoreductase chain 6
MEHLFFFFSSCALISAIMVITASNPVHSVLFLILVFFNGSGLLILLGLDFFAMIFLVVYVGAIAVLFLFVVMMLNIKLAEISDKKLRYFPIGGLLGLLFLFEIFLIVDNDGIPFLYNTEIATSWWAYFTSSEIKFLYPQGVQVMNEENPLLNGNSILWNGDISHGYNEWSSLCYNFSNMKAIGDILYTYYFFYFLYASIILLVAMLGAIVLTMHKGVQTKRQEVFSQNNREFAKTITKL